MIVGCLADRVGRARIEDGAKNFEHIEWLDTFAQVAHRISQDSSNVTGVVVGWADREGLAPGSLIVSLRRDFPSIPILGYCLSSAEHLEDLRRMAVAGVHSLLLDSTADSRTVVRSMLETTRRRCAATQIFAQISHLVPTKLHPLVQAALDNPAETTSVSGLARVLEVDRKTLHNWCRSENFLGPRDLLRWSRLLLAAALLNWNRRSVTSVALELDFPTDNSLRIAIRRQFKVQPSAMKRGGVDRAVNAFAAHVARYRHRQVPAAIA